MLIELYTDGACLGNPGFGGWGVFVGGGWEFLFCFFCLRGRICFHCVTYLFNTQSI